MASSVLTHQLGKNGPGVSALGFGAMGLSASYGKIETDEQRFKVLDKAFKLGATFWDTSDAYGDSEDLLGRWFSKTGNRNKIFLATKFGVTRMPDGSNTVRSDAAFVKEACEKSLKRLGISKIDLYYCHRVDKKTPIEETVQVMTELLKEGKIGAIGLSEVSATTLRRAQKVHRIAAVQLEYSPFALDIESPEIKLLSTCRELGIAIVAYSPLGRGFLTGQLKSPEDFEDGDFRKYSPRYSKENFPKNLNLVKVLEGHAKRKGCTVGQLTLAWLLEQGDDIIPIPGTKRIKYLEENMKALDVKLTSEEVQDIRAEISKVEVAGDRYPAFFQQYSFADTPALNA